MPRVDLPLDEKVKLIHSNGSGKSQRSLATEFNISVGAVNNIIKKKRSYLDAFEQSTNSTYLKRHKTNGMVELNSAVQTWFETARSKQMPISGPLLQEKARYFARELGIENFKASNGWLQRFRGRNDIVFRTISGESNDVREETVTEWTEKLHELIDGYNPEDVFNCDETGLFYRALPDRSLVSKFENCHGTKGSKDRITLLFTCSFTGEKLKPLVIGKSQKPRCFKHVDVDKLPVDYYANKMAWMNSTLFADYLKSVDKIMRRKNRQIILFLDNAPCHPQGVTLTNTKLAFFPANTTSRLQPLDQGIIKSFKSHYRKELLTTLLAKMDTCESSSELSKQINVLDAIKWSHKAWSAVSAETITNCFRKAGFTDGSSGSATGELDDIPQGLDELVRSAGEAASINPVSTEEFLNIDADAPTCELDDGDWEQEIITKVRPRSGEESEDAPSDTPPVKVTFKEALKAADTLKLFACDYSMDFTDLVYQVESSISGFYLEQRTKASTQCKISEWLVKK